MDIIILGPSNSGKTNLANFLASQINFPIFNCDSIQVYKNLNLLTNKPEFTSTSIVEDEVFSTTKIIKNLDYEKYKNIKFKVWAKNNENIENFEFEEIAEFLNFFKKTNYNLATFSTIQSYISNYLFDIKEPLQNYSTLDFEKDLERITEKFNLKNRIIVGGTIYYAYNFLLQLKSFEETENWEITSEKFENISEMLQKLEELDSESLNLIDRKNPRRIESALNYILKTGKKYSENYKKDEKLRDNFFLIELLPKNREEYYKNLDETINSRLNPKTFEELDFLIKKYGEKVIPWLEKASYEYKYFLQIYSLIKKNNIEFESNLNQIKEIMDILQTLKFKEHQYAKRQMTFLRRLERKIENGI